MVEVLVLKIILLFVLLVLTLAFALAPLKVVRILRKRALVSADKTIAHARNWSSLVLCLLTCFTGGVFLATCFLHLLPEAVKHAERLSEQYDWHTDYPIAELVSCICFFLVFLVEELVVAVIKRTGGGVHQGPSVLHVHFSQQQGKTHQNHHDNSELHQTVLDTNTNGRLLGREENGKAEDELPDTRFLPDNSVHSPEEVRAHSPCHQEHCTEGYDVPARAEPECCQIETGDATTKPTDSSLPVTFRPHAHHHGVRSFTLVLALSLHSVIEGLAFGIQTSNDRVTALFVSIISHKLIMAFGTGLQLARTHPHRLKLVVATMIGFSLMCPVGTAVGICVETGSTVSQPREVMVLFFEALSVGTFLYVTFFEVFIHERDNDHPALLKLLATVVGFVILAAVRSADTGHSHGGHQAEALGANSTTTASTIMDFRY